MRECIIVISGPGMGASDARSAPKGLTPRLQVFWRMLEDEPLALSSRSILGGWRMLRTLSTWRKFTLLVGTIRIELYIHVLMPALP